MTDRIAPAGVALGRQASLQSLQARLAQATAELSSGRKSDPTGGLGLGASLLYKLHDQIAQGEALNETVTLAGKRLETMQTSLTAVAGTVQQLSTGVLQVDTLKGVGRDVLAAQARDSMATMVDRLNVQFDGQHLFGGTDGAGAPLRSPEDDATVPVTGPLATIREMLTQSVTTNGGAPLDKTTVMTFVNDVKNLFDDPAAAKTYQGVFYTSASKSGDGKPSQIAIGAGETLSYDVRADNQAFKDAFQATSLLSLLDASGEQLTDEAKDALLNEAGQLLRGSHAQITTVAGTLGAKQKRLEAVADIQSKAMDAAAAQINDLEATDYAATADRVNQLQLQLQATYAITAKLSELSLVNYLR